MKQLLKYFATNFKAFANNRINIASTSTAQQYFFIVWTVLQFFGVARQQPRIEVKSQKFLPDIPGNNQLQAVSIATQATAFRWMSSPTCHRQQRQKLQFRDSPTELNLPLEVNLCLSNQKKDFLPNELLKLLCSIRLVVPAKWAVWQPKSIHNYLDNFSTMSTASAWGGKSNIEVSMRCILARHLPQSLPCLLRTH